MSIEAMKMALEALELAKNSHGMMLLSDPPQEAWKTYRVDDAIKKSTTALRQAIEQTQKQEPVTLPCCDYTDASAIKWNRFNDVVQCHNCGQTYEPPQRQPLTDEQIFEVHKRVDSMQYLTFARAIEAAHGIKGKA